MKKTSINKKLFYSINCLIILVIFFIWIINTLILRRYYFLEKKQSLVKIFDTINTYCTSENVNANLEQKLETLDSSKNIDIVIRNGMDVTIYTTSKDFSRNRMLFPNNEGAEFKEESIEDKFKSGENYGIEVLSDARLEKDFINLFGKLDNGYLVFIRSPIESIEESVSISNRFLIFIGLLSIVISSICAFIISRHLTRPLTELDTIAQKMSNLDFSQKYTVTTRDEIGTLGISINRLSDNLEKTIQDLKETNMELEKDIEETSKISEMRSQFVSDVSHELKTPIALIQGYAEGLVDNVISSDEDKKYYAEVILDEANKMSELTKDLLDLSKLEYGKNELHIEEFDITEMVQTFLKKNDILFTEKDISVDFQPEKELLVSGDVFRIEQVLTNYITNAIKNVDENKKIKVSITEKDNLVRVGVFNTGVQLSDEDRMRIWKRFYKLDISRSREQGGTGLGLSVVKAIMTQHHTACGVDNVDGGVEFWFELEKSK
ncbi:MAG: HAMP domain-containing protein [Clostridia bacterium]|nr:HAMP domain-containing protein [Clostridia bacterium]